MKIKQWTWTMKDHWNELLEGDWDVFFVFSDIKIKDEIWLSDLKKIQWTSKMIGCTTSGEINNKETQTNSVVLTAIKFDSEIKLCLDFEKKDIMTKSQEQGSRLGKKIKEVDNNWNHIFVFGPGVHVNGSGFIRGMLEEVNVSDGLSGGLAGDGGAFEKTFIFFKGDWMEDAWAGAAIKGEYLTFATVGSAGWIPFGPERKVTAHENNILLELDGEQALNVYKKYLGDYAKQLPKSGLLFPFLMKRKSGEKIIRTIVGVDEERGGILLAGDIEDHCVMSLMHANTDLLINEHEECVENLCQGKWSDSSEKFVLAISCVGRRLVMGSRIDEEVEIIKELMPSVTVAGFHSHGEVGSLHNDKTELHNQTLILTFMKENHEKNA